MRCNMPAVLIVAHAPLASALRSCALHVFPQSADAVLALDVPADESPERTLERARELSAQLGTAKQLVMTDLFGATPSNVAAQLVDGVNLRLVAGVNLPMLLRAVTYRAEPLESLVSRALLGGAQGVMPVAVTAPQHQTKRVQG